MLNQRSKPNKLKKLFNTHICEKLFSCFMLKKNYLLNEMMKKGKNHIWGVFGSDVTKFLTHTLITTKKGHKSLTPQ